MARYAALLFAVTLLLPAGVIADVTPFPAWRVVTDGPTTVTQSGNTVYVGGSFGNLWRGIPEVDGFFDPVTGALGADQGCARENGLPIEGSQPDARGGTYYRVDSRLFSDGAGSILAPADVPLVRIGPDCRLDSTFVPHLPIAAHALHSFVPHENRVFISTNLYGLVFVAALDAVDGHIVGVWPVPGLMSLTLLASAGPGRIAGFAAVPGFGAERAVVWFDTDTGHLNVPPQDLFAITRAVAVRPGLIWASTAGAPLRLLDPATLQPPSGWTDPPLTGVVEDAFVAGNRVLVRGLNLSVAGTPVGALAAFDLSTGAWLSSWQAPPWIRRVWSLRAVGSILFVHGDFADDAPRHQIAALDLETGVLAAWDTPYRAGGYLRRVGSQIWTGPVRGRDRVTRARLAAVDVVTGNILPWSADLPLVNGERPTVTAVTTDGIHLYAAAGTSVYRFPLSGGVPDPSWRVDVRAPENTAITSLERSATTLFVGGDFAEASTDGTTWLPRGSALAVSLTTPQITAWHPNIQRGCVYIQELKPGIGMPFPTPCVTDLLVAGDRVVVAGRFDAVAGQVHRALAVTDAATGQVVAPSANLPVNTVARGVASDGTTIYVSARQGESGSESLATLDATSGALTVFSGPTTIGSGLATFGGRVYALFERNTVDGTRTTNPAVWSNPVAGESGVFHSASLGLEYHPQLANDPLPAPETLTAEVQNSTVLLSWREPSGLMTPLGGNATAPARAADRYTLEAGSTSGASNLAQIPLTFGTNVFMAAVPNGTYFVRVRAGNSVGEGTPSNEVIFSVGPAVPNAPGPISAQVTGSTVVLTWSAPSGGAPVTHYVLSAGTSSGLPNLGSVPVAGGVVVVPNVAPGTYYVRVQAANAVGVGPASAEATIVVP